MTKTFHQTGLIIKSVFMSNMLHNFFCLPLFFSGSMGTSVLDRRAFLCGASAGTYALLSAHVANILLVSVEMIQALDFSQ